jgi:L-serine dehydratase
MERISVFDIFKVGIGPSSSHTMGPWKAALAVANIQFDINSIEKVQVHLYGSLAKTGIGHGTDIAVQLGLENYQAETIPVELVNTRIKEIANQKQINLFGKKPIAFDPSVDILFHKDESLPYHPNGLSFEFTLSNQETIRDTYFSVGGGFIVKEGEEDEISTKTFKFPIDAAKDLEKWCKQENCSPSYIILQNELSWKTEEEITSFINNIWDTMFHSIYRGCHKDGILPGGLDVVRRAAILNKELLPSIKYDGIDEWFELIKIQPQHFQNIMGWISAFALAVNEENAAFGRIVTAPTNGSAGVIPAVLMYHLAFNPNAKKEDITPFLLTAGEIGSIFKKRSTISAAMGGCQAEIGVSSAMAAAALVEVLNGEPARVMMASEIAMEHHLGLTCDPIGGLVQIPCIERNTMGAIKAITAAQIAMTRDPENAKVSLDDVISSMWETALDMNTKYKETSEGGLATNISVNVPEC